MGKGNVPWLRLVNKGHVMTSVVTWQGRGGRGVLGPDVPHVLSLSNLHAAGVSRRTEASAQALRPGSGPQHSYLVDLVLVKVLELPLEAQVGVGAWSPSTHGVQGILPAKVSDSHDVRSHQRHTPGDTGQAVGPRAPNRQSTCRPTPASPDPPAAGGPADLVLESLPALDCEWTASQHVTWKLLRNTLASITLESVAFFICFSLLFYGFSAG